MTTVVLRGHDKLCVKTLLGLADKRALAKPIPFEKLSSKSGACKNKKPNKEQKNQRTRKICRFRRNMFKGKKLTLYTSKYRLGRGLEKYLLTRVFGQVLAQKGLGMVLGGPPDKKFKEIPHVTPHHYQKMLPKHDQPKTMFSTRLHGFNQHMLTPKWDPSVLK